MRTMRIFYGMGTTWESLPEYLDQQRQHGEASIGLDYDVPYYYKKLCDRESRFQ